MRRPFVLRPEPPPAFPEARNPRQRVRACGMHPDHWYPVALETDVKPGEAVKVRFWGRPVAVFRTASGAWHAIDDRCAHRQVSLAAGDVVGEHLVCRYHGWAYDGSGCVAHIPHETFGKKTPRFRVESFAVRVRYGLVWVFFGDEAGADQVPLPELPEVDGPDAWVVQPVTYRWQAHHSMIFDNVSDYTHGWLHRKTQPFQDEKLIHVKPEGDRVHVRYHARIGATPMIDALLHRGQMGSNTIDLTYDYPYFRANTDDYIRMFMAPLPEDQRTTRVFVLIAVRRMRLPLLGATMPRVLERAVMRLGKRLFMDPVFREDAAALELEQEGWEAHWQAPLAELNPQVRAFQDLTIRRWEAYLRSVGELPADAPEAAPRAAASFVAPSVAQPIAQQEAES